MGILKPSTLEMSKKSRLLNWFRANSARVLGGFPHPVHCNTPPQSPVSHEPLPLPSKLQFLRPHIRAMAVPGGTLMFQLWPRSSRRPPPTGVAAAHTEQICSKLYGYTDDEAIAPSVPNLATKVFSRDETCSNEHESNKRIFCIIWSLVSPFEEQAPASHLGLDMFLIHMFGTFSSLLGEVKYELGDYESSASAYKSSAMLQLKVTIRLHLDFVAVSQPLYLDWFGNFYVEGLCELLKESYLQIVLERLPAHEGSSSEIPSQQAAKLQELVEYIQSQLTLPCGQRRGTQLQNQRWVAPASNNERRNWVAPAKAVDTDSDSGLNRNPNIDTDGGNQARKGKELMAVCAPDSNPITMPVTVCVEQKKRRSSIRPSILPSDLLLFLWREVVLDIENLSDLLDSFAFDHGRKSLDQYLHQLTYPQIVCRLAECTLQYSRIFASVLPSTLSNGMIESSPKLASSTTNLTVCDSTATDFATTNSSPSLALSLTIFSPSLTPEEDMMADDFSGKCVDGFIIEVVMHQFLAPLGSTKSHLDLDS
nr:hypothetical protein C2845_PM04G30420 [Ipomoea trifida]